MHHTQAVRNLIMIKLLHTLIWAIMAGAVFALPVLAFTHQFRWVVILTGLILFECLVLAVNHGRCPLTDWAAHYTDARADNFDIYLPNRIARYNKEIFGTLFIVHELIVLWCWLART